MLKALTSRQELLSTTTDAARFFNYITTRAQFKAALLRLKNASYELALDTETGIKPEWRGKVEESKTNPIKPRLCPHLGHICILSLTPKTGKTEVFDFILLKHNEVDLTPLYNLLKSKLLIAHKAQFDGKMLMGEFGRNDLTWFCTLQADKVLSNATGSKFGMMRGHSLYACLRDYFNVILTGKGKQQTDNWDLEPESRRLDNPYWLDMITYAASDTRYLHRLKDFLTQWLTRPLPSDWLNIHDIPDENCGWGMEEAVQLEMDMINPMIEMEFYGFPVSRFLVNYFQSEVEFETWALACDLSELLGIPLPPPDPCAEFEKPTEQTLKTFNNPKKITQLLNEAGVIAGDAQKLTLMRVLALLKQNIEIRSEEEADPLAYINEEEQEVYKVLEEFETSLLVKGSEILDTLLKYKRSSKQTGMSMEPFINPATGCIHPSIKGPVSTGRMAMGEPNFQQVSNNVKVVLELDLIDGSLQHYSDAVWTPYLTTQPNLTNPTNPTEDS